MGIASAVSYLDAIGAYESKSASISSDASSNEEVSNALAEIMQGEVLEPPTHAQQYFVTHYSQSSSESDDTCSSKLGLPLRPHNTILSNVNAYNRLVLSLHLNALFELPQTLLLESTNLETLNLWSTILKAFY